MRMFLFLPLLALLAAVEPGHGQDPASPVADQETVSALVHDAMAGALTGDPRRVASVRQVMQEDQTEAPDSWSGVLDDVAVLEILSASITQKEKAEKIDALAADLNDPVARERLMALSKRVEEYRLETLTRKQRLNRVTGVVNRAWKTTSQVLAGQPRALAVAGVDSFDALTGRDEPDTVEKKLAYLAKIQEIRGEASPEEVEKGRQIIASLEEKRSKSEQRLWKNRIEEAIDIGFWAQADRLCEVGQALWPEETWFGETRADIARRVAEEERTRTVDPQSVAPLTQEDRAKADLWRSQLAGGVEQESLVSDQGSREMIGEAMTERRTKTLDYLIFGETSTKSIGKRAVKTAVARGSDAPGAIAFLQGAETLIRGVSLLFGNELGVQQAIETYAYIERENPATLTEKDYRKWADLCADLGDYREALAVLERGQVADDGLVSKYRNRWAKAILNRCEELPPGTARFEAIQFVREELADTSGARRAEDLLLATPATDRPLVLVKKKFLLAFEPHLAESGFQFEKTWWDGIEDNGEVARDETYWDPDGAIWFRVGKKSPWRKVSQPAEHLDTIRAVFARIEEAVEAEALQEGRRGKRKFPVEIEGEIGSSSFVTPKFVQFDTTEPDDSLFE